MKVPPFLLLPPALNAERDTIWYGIALCSAGVSCPCCAPSQRLMPPPACLLVGWGERQKRPGLWVSTAQQQQEHPCVIDIVFSTNPKYSPIPATLKKINSVPAKSSTRRFAGEPQLCCNKQRIGYRVSDSSALLSALS